MTTQDRRRAEKMAAHSGLNYQICANIVSGINRKDYVTLAKAIENNLLTGEQNETLKDCGLTVFDLIVGTYDEVLSGVVQNILDDWNERFGTVVFTGVIER